MYKSSQARGLGIRCKTGLHTLKADPIYSAFFLSAQAICRRENIHMQYVYMYMYIHAVAQEPYNVHHINHVQLVYMYKSDIHLLAILWFTYYIHVCTCKTEHVHVHVQYLTKVIVGKCQIVPETARLRTELKGSSI